MTGARQTPAQAAKVGVVLQGQPGARAQRLRRPFARVLPRIAQVIEQPVRRVCQGEMVPAPDTRVRLFEPHTQSIVRRKTGTPVALGRTGGLDEVAGGLLSGSRILAEAGPDFPSRPDRRAAQAQRVGRPPQWLAADRGV
jgi:hypothetical protein